MARKKDDKFSHLSEDDQESIARVRDIARYFGRALCFTIMCAQYPSGASMEDELIEKADEAWVALADRIIEFALEDK